MFWSQRQNNNLFPKKGAYYTWMQLESVQVKKSGEQQKQGV